MTISTASPSSSSVTNPAISQDDEIDLFELVENLWQEKILIVAITALVTLVAVVYALTATPVYQARTSVIAPFLADIQGYNQGRQEAKLKLLNTNDVFQSFTRELASTQLLNSFFEQVYLPYLPPEKQVAASRTLLSGLRNILTIKTPDARDINKVYQVSV